MRNAPRILVVGDVHGCADELDALLRVAGYEPGDELVFVGDLVAKGPDTPGVLARARALSARSVKGNHEAKLLGYRAAVARMDADGAPRLSRTHRHAVDALGAEDWAYLEALPALLPLPAHSAVVVHAGVDPSRALDEQDEEVLTNVRSLRPDGTPTSRLEEGTPWIAGWTGPTTILFGHDAIRGLQVSDHAIGLDSGCVYGGALTCVELPTLRRYSVRAKRPWCPT